MPLLNSLWVLSNDAKHGVHPFHQMAKEIKAANRAFDAEISYLKFENPANTVFRDRESLWEEPAATLSREALFIYKKGDHAGTIVYIPGNASGKSASFVLGPNADLIARTFGTGGKHTGNIMDVIQYIGEITEHLHEGNDSEFKYSYK